MLNRVLPLHQTENITIAVIIAKYLNEFIFYSSVAPLKLMIQNFFPMIKEHCLHLNLWCRMKFYGKNSMNEFSLKWYLRFNIKCCNPWANHNLTRVRKISASTRYNTTETCSLLDNLSFKNTFEAVVGFCWMQNYRRI